MSNLKPTTPAARSARLRAWAALVAGAAAMNEIDVTTSLVAPRAVDWGSDDLHDSILAEAKSAQKPVKHARKSFLPHSPAVSTHPIVGTKLSRARKGRARI